jgi:hypothetical protein
MLAISTDLKMKRTLAKYLACFAALLVTTTAAIGQAPESQRTNVILLVLDQLQADRLHCYGNPRLPTER